MCGRAGFSDRFFLGQTSKMEENLYSVIERKTYVELSANGGYFSKFAWQPEPYDNFKERGYNEHAAQAMAVEALESGEMPSESTRFSRVMLDQ